jgi:threonine synthase
MAYQAPDRLRAGMKYVSTRGTAPPLTFEEVLLTGLARDGGLYLPATWPRFTPAEIAALAGLGYEDAAFRIMRPFTGDAFTEAEFRGLIGAAYGRFAHAARVPLTQTGANDFLLELFHGPTLAFKDVAMLLIGRMFAHVLRRRGGRVTILGATSGDTGSAAIEAFRGLAGTDVFIMYPHGRVSDVQRRQMTTPSEANVHALAVDGDFDTCQALLKELFNEHTFRDEVALAGVNSINWARVMAQIVYYFTAAVALGAPHRPVAFTVPTGNFGDIFAGWAARQMGLPIERLVIATNQNDILHRVLESGEYRPGTVLPSISPSMDIQVASNFERLVYALTGEDGPATAELMREPGGFALPQGGLAAMRDIFASARIGEAETTAEIARTRRESGMLVCPHTAVGLAAARLCRGDPRVPMVSLATAHPAKFPDAVRAATGATPELPPFLADQLTRPERVARVAGLAGAIKTIIRQRIAA